jgi:transposase
MENESKARKPTGTRYSDEVRERAVRMVFEHQHEYQTQGAAIRSIASKMGMSRETLRNWIIQAERDRGQRAGATTSELARLKELERENRELRTANEILRKASAYFAQAELDRRSKPRLRSSTSIATSTVSSRSAACC